jgi:hypothetical protein
MTRLLAEIRTNGEEMRTNQEGMGAETDVILKEMKAGQEHLKEEIMAYLKLR